MGRTKNDTMPLEDHYDSDDSDQEQVTQRQPRGPVSAPSLEDEEAFPDFGTGGPASAAPAPNFMKAWSSSKAPTNAPKPSAPKPRRAAPVAVMSDVAEMGAPVPSAAPQRSGGGVSWNESQWSSKSAQANLPTWSSKGNLGAGQWEQAKKSAGTYCDPYAREGSYSTSPVKKKVPTREATQSAAAAPVAEAPKQRAPKKSSKDADGFTEVAVKKREDKKKDDKWEGQVLGGNTAFAALDDKAAPEKEAPGASKKKKGGQKKGSEKKESSKAEEAEPEVKIIDTAGRNKKKKAKAKEEEDPFTADTSSKKGSKKGKKDAAKGGLPMGVIGAALVGVAGVAYYFSTVGGAGAQ